MFVSYWSHQFCIFAQTDIQADEQPCFNPLVAYLAYTTNAITYPPAFIEGILTKAHGFDVSEKPVLMSVGAGLEPGYAGNKDLPGSFYVASCAAFQPEP